MIVDTAFDCELEVDMDVGPVDDFHDLPVPNGKDLRRIEPTTPWPRIPAVRGMSIPSASASLSFVRDLHFVQTLVKHVNFQLVLPLLIADQ